MNEADRMQKDAEIAHFDGSPLGSDRPAFAIPQHPSEPPMVMPLAQVNAQLSKGSQAGTLNASLAGITGTMRDMITSQDGQPLDREGVGTDPTLPAQQIVMEPKHRLGM